MTTAFDVLVVGSVNVDIVARGASLPRPNETCAAEELVEGYGGKGANQAIAAARFGARVAMVASIGDDARGAGARRNLEEAHVDVDHVRAVAGVATGVAVIHVGGGGEKAIMAVKGANARLSPADVDAARALVDAHTIVIAQLEVPDDAVLAAAQLARERGARFVLDPAPARALPDELWPLVDLVKPNALEAAALTGIAVTDRASAIRAAEVLLDRGARAVAIASPEGTHLLAREPARLELHAKRIAVATVDATGAGDAFLAAVAVVLAEGGSFEVALRFANATAALKTTKSGAQLGLPTRADVDAFIASSLRTTHVGVDPPRD
jgi:ribokinase